MEKVYKRRNHIHGKTHTKPILVKLVKLIYTNFKCLMNYKYSDASFTVLLPSKGRLSPTTPFLPSKQVPPITYTTPAPKVAVLNVKLIH